MVASTVFWVQIVEFLSYQLLQFDLQLEVSVLFTHHWCQQQVVSWLRASPGNLAHAAVVIIQDRCWCSLIKWNYPSLEVTAIKYLSLPTSFYAPPSVVSFSSSKSQGELSSFNLHQRWIGFFSIFGASSPVLAQPAPKVTQSIISTMTTR